MGLNTRINRKAPPDDIRKEDNGTGLAGQLLNCLAYKYVFSAEHSEKGKRQKKNGHRSSFYNLATNLHFSLTAIFY